MDYIEENKILQENIRTLCQKDGISVSDLEKILSFGNGAIGKWAKSHKRPNYERVLAVAQYFGVSVEYLRGTEQDDQARAEGGVSLQSLRDDERILLDSYRGMTERDREMMRSFARRLRNGD